jgi:uracil-DNA glycosylase
LVQQHSAHEQLSRHITNLAEGKFGDQIEVAWRDFNMTDLTDSSTLTPVRSRYRRARTRGCGERARRVPPIESGSREYEWMLVGEQLGNQEDLEGKPFVGPAGKLLGILRGRY